MKPPINRPRPRTTAAVNPMLRNKPPQNPKPGGMPPGVVPPKMAGGAVGARKAQLKARSQAAGTMKGGY